MKVKKNIKKLLFKVDNLLPKAIFYPNIKRVIKRIDQLSPYPIFYTFIMTDAEKDIFDRAIKKANHYLEFGMGGSTLRALLNSKTKIYTVESSRRWINYMRKYLIIRILESKRIYIYHADIGQVREWGYPVSNKISVIFEAYSGDIFKYIDSSLLDLALVDGRFRVACILKLIMECSKNKQFKLLIHDFWNRPHYQVVSKYLDIVERADTIGLFTIKPNVDLSLVKEEYEKFKLIAK